MMILNILGLHIDNDVRPKQTTILTKKNFFLKDTKIYRRITHSFQINEAEGEGSPVVLWAAF